MAEGEIVRWDMLKVMDLHIRGYIRSLGKKVLHRSHCQYFESVFK